MKKKIQKKLYKTNSNNNVEYLKIIKIVIGVVIVLGLTYFFTALATGEIRFGKKAVEKKEVHIQYEEIMAGQIFNRSDEEYYVFLFNFTDTYASYYLSLRDSYLEREKTLPLYILDLEKKVNYNYVLQDGENYVNHPMNLSQFKASNPTIVHIKNQRVIERITGRENVLKFLEEN